VLDPPTFRGSPLYEVPTRPHTFWCRSLIRYDGLVSIILKICLSSCFSTRESGLLYLITMRFACLVSVSVNFVKILSSSRERVEVSLQSKGKSPNSVRDIEHSTTCENSSEVVHMDAVITNTQEGITRTTIDRVFRTSAMVVITSLWERLCLMSGEEAHTSKTTLTNYATHFHKHMY